MSSDDQDPAVTDWRATGLSTSAQLRAENKLLSLRLEAVKRELISERGSYNRLAELSKADATTMRQARKECDDANERSRRWMADAERLAGELEHAERELAEEKRLHAVTANQLADVVGELNRLRAELRWQTGRSS